MPETKAVASHGLPDRAGWLLFAVVASIAALAMVGVILAALLMPYLQAQREAARRRQIQENLERLGTALEQHRAKAIGEAAGKAPDSSP
jgi:type II secretory pathway pseudopilin PulG